jgi:hypothetical protein
LKTELWQHLESILLLLIGPSSQIRISVMPRQYELYGMLVQLRALIEWLKDLTPVSVQVVLLMATLVRDASPIFAKYGS